MAAYRISAIADLARQLAFSPVHARATQIDAAEELLHTIAPGKAYPMEFVVFRITGYHPKTSSAVATEQGEELLAGLAIQHDLGQLIEDLSDSLNVETASLPEPVLTIDDVTERFNVTSKTIQRWRRKGLPARRFIFPDGKRRVGFYVRSIERFVALHSEEVSQATNFTQLSLGDRDEIVRRARRLAVTCQCCINEIARRIAKKMRRSPLTILHTIKRYDAENPQLAVFALASEPIKEDERSRLARSFRKGTPLKVIARRVCRPRAVVYRAIIEERLDRITQRKQKFIDDPLYHQPNAGSVVDQIVKSEELAAQRSKLDERVPKDIPAYFQSLYRTALLTPGRERAMFLKFNYHKYQFVSARRKLDPAYARARDVSRLEGYLRKATETKNAIVAANLRLVVSVARKHVRPGVDLMELVSEGNITLMRAVESFDAHKGNKFSTYATLALMKGFARSVPLMQSATRKAGLGEEVLTRVADDRSGQGASGLSRQDELRALLVHLSPTERAALLHAYDVDGSHRLLRDVSPTESEMRATLAMSRSRLKQVEQKAMEKLRNIVSAG